MNRFADLDKRIKEKDIFMLREALGNTIYGCRDFSDGEFDGAVRYVESKGIKIKDDELKGELVSTGKSSYTADDFADAIAELKENFCDERIEDVKKIGKALYGKNKKPAEPSESAQDKPDKRNKQDQGIVKLIKDLLKDLWDLLKSLGSRNFSAIRSKWQQLCRNAANNARRTALGKKLSKILNKTPRTAEDAKEQINEIKNEMQNINEAVCLIEAAYLYEEYQTDSSSAFQQNEPESKTPYVHRVEYNWYDPNLMDLKRLPSDEEQDSVTEPS